MSSGHRESGFVTVVAALIMAVGVALVMRSDAGRPRRSAGLSLTPAQEPLELQNKRAAEAGRGRSATSPLAIPWAGWKDILWRTYSEIQHDRLLAIAAGVVFYSLLALFPAITAGVSVYGMFADAATLTGHLADLSTLLPGGALDVISEQVTRIIQRGTGELTIGFVFGLALALWSANAGMKAIFDALNVIYDEEEKRGFFKLNAISLLMTITAIALVLVMVVSVTVVPLLIEKIGLGNGVMLLFKYGRWPAMFVIFILALAVLYRVGPSRASARWRWLSVGSLSAALLWLVMSIGFSWYVANFGTYNATYGSLGAAIGMMMWMWLSMIVVLVGAELNSEIEHQTARDSTTGAPRPLGWRGATMADTVGKAQG